MKCPLLTLGSYACEKVPEWEARDCLQEECAWWYAQNGVCAILTLAQGAVYTHKALLSLDSKIPFGGKA